MTTSEAGKEGGGSLNGHWVVFGYQRPPISCVFQLIQECKLLCLKTCSSDSYELQEGMTP